MRAMKRRLTYANVVATLASCSASKLRATISVKVFGDKDCAPASTVSVAIAVTQAN